MRGSVLHGTWLPAEAQLFIWAETLDPPPRRGRQPRVPRHPFALPAEPLDDLVAGLSPEPLSATEHTTTIWLPSSGRRPQPSPELIALGAAEPEPEGLELRPWQLAGFLLPIDEALDILLALDAAQPHGADLRFWRLAALLTFDLVARQQLAPALLRDGVQLRARWQPRPDHTAAQRIATLVRAMPPLCRAAVADAADAPPPSALVDSFVAVAVDAVARGVPYRPRLPRTTPGGAWLAALVGHDSRIKLGGPAAEALFDAWQSWSAELFGTQQIAGNGAFHITFRLEPPARQPDQWRIALLLQATDDPSLLVPAGAIWRERSAEFRYLDRRFDQPHERLLTGLGFAAGVFPPLARSLRSATPEHADLDADEALAFLREAGPLLEQSGFGVLVPAWWRTAAVKARAHLSAPRPQPDSQGILSFERLVSFRWELTLGDATLDPAEFRQLVALKQPLVQVRGQWVALDPAQSTAILRLLDEPEHTMALGDALRLGLSGAGVDAPAGVEVAGVEVAGWLRELMERLEQPGQIAQLPPPPGLVGTLRPYQQRGYSWLRFLRELGFGACLADDMGLGKSIQTISLLLGTRTPASSPALIISPTSVIGNWQRELGRFAPQLRVLIHHGPTRAQGAQFAAATAEHDVVLTSYPLLARDRATVTAVTWDTLVLDEAQNIKSPAARQTEAARALSARQRVALTGTPVENRLSDLWSIMQFLNPRYLGTEAAFRREFARPIERTADPDAAARLRRLTAPFVLRRVKTDPTVIADLPAKIETNVYCSLTPEQVTLYEAVVQDALAALDQPDAPSGIQRRGQVLAMLMKLKQVCNHPAQLLKDGSPLPGRSGKLVRLREMLEEVYAAGDRALIFTQFSEMGAMLRAYLAAAFWDDALFLHGGTPLRERDAMVQRFQAPDGPRVFILSLKAGGTGLNLTAANHVFHFDRWWNPAVESQATDRAFRIGQTRNVQVHTFICSGTVEEHIDELIAGKRALAASVVGAGEGWLTELSTTQLRELVTLRRSAMLEE